MCRAVFSQIFPEVVDLPEKSLTIQSNRSQVASSLRTVSSIEITHILNCSSTLALQKQVSVLCNHTSVRQL